MKKIRWYFYLIIFCCMLDAIASMVCDTMQQNADEALRKAFSISDVDWRAFQKKISEQKKHFAQKRSDYIHDQSIPKEMLARVYTLLKKYGIEPSSIDIKITDAEGYFAAVSFSVSRNRSCLHLNIKSLETTDYFEFVIVHEIGHLLNGHQFRYIIEELLFRGCQCINAEKQAKQCMADNRIPYEKFTHYNDQENVRRRVEHVKFLQENGATQEEIKKAKNDLQEELTFLLLLYNLPKRQFEAYCNWRKVREFVADQYIASQDIHMLKKGFYYCKSGNQATQSTGEPINAGNSYYPSAQESYVSFRDNLVKPRNELQYLLQA